MIDQLLRHGRSILERLRAVRASTVASWSAGASAAVGNASENAPDANGPDAPPPIWQVMLDGFHDPALVMDGALTVLAANGAAHIAIGVTLGRHIAQTSRAPDLLAAAERALATNGAQDFEVRALVPTERLLSGRVTPLQRTARPPIQSPSLLLVLRDLTEQDGLTRLRADFVANASHELRTPLASLKGYVETLQGAAKDDPAARARFLPIMQAEADRMARLIDDLLSLSRIEMHEHVPPRDIVDLGSVAAEVAMLLRPLAETARQTIVLAPRARDFNVVGDHDELLQVVHNLVQNAIKYGKPDGTINLSLRTVGTQVALSVADDGIGIATHHLPRLTERFYRVSAKASRARGGTGLGLAIVKHIVNRHRGALSISSTPDHGSDFVVTLPMA